MFKLNNIFLSLVLLFSFGFMFSNVNATLGSRDASPILYDFNPTENFTPYFQQPALRMLNLDLANQKINPTKKIVIITRQQSIIVRQSPPTVDKTSKAKKIAKLVNSTKRLNKRTIAKKSPTKPNYIWQPKSKKLRTIYRKILTNSTIPKKALTTSFKYYERNVRRRGLSKKYIAVADYTKLSRHNRLHLINISTGRVLSYPVSHAKKSGPFGGRVLTTSNRVGSNKTSKGFFKVGFREGITATKRYKYLTVRGLGRANRKVGWPTRLGGRDVIIHSAKYANNGGRSEGCFVIRPRDRKAVFSRIKGSLFYSYTG